MRTREIFAVYFAGLLQGITLVAFPAASTIFTDPQGFDLSSTAYGALFVPQTIAAIGASLLSTKFFQRWGLKPVFLIGLLANLLSMALLATSSRVMHHHALAMGLLLLATACLGVGFGLLVPAVNTLSALFFPLKVDSAILILNALLGLGTALAPVFVALFVGFGMWWGLPLLLVMFLLGLILFSVSVPLLEGDVQTNASMCPHAIIPFQFWTFAAFALLYGIVETLNGNWATLYMSQNIGASSFIASLALTCFWTMVTLGRVFFALIEKFFSESYTYRLLPFVAAVAFILLSCLAKGHSVWGILAFGLAGIGCSALLPLTLSFGSRTFPSIPTFVVGGLIAFYLMGYGIAAFGVGSLQGMAGINLKVIFGGCTVIALTLGSLSFVVTKILKR